jgi:hypothetical protein
MRAIKDAGARLRQLASSNFRSLPLPPPSTPAPHHVCGGLTCCIRCSVLKRTTRPAGMDSGRTTTTNTNELIPANGLDDGGRKGAEEIVCNGESRASRRVEGRARDLEGLMRAANGRMQGWPRGDVRLCRGQLWEQPLAR